MLPIKSKENFENCVFNVSDEVLKSKNNRVCTAS